MNQTPHRARGNVQPSGLELFVGFVLLALLVFIVGVAVWQVSRVTDTGPEVDPSPKSSQESMTKALAEITRDISLADPLVYADDKRITLRLTETTGCKSVTYVVSPSADLLRVNSTYAPAVCSNTAKATPVNTSTATLVRDLTDTDPFQHFGSSGRMLQTPISDAAALTEIGRIDVNLVAETSDGEGETTMRGFASPGGSVAQVETASPNGTSAGAAFPQ